MSSAAPSESTSGWTFLTNHAHVLLCLSRNPDQPLREVALAVGVTERAVQRIVSDLEAEGYLVRERLGRRNHYEINDSQPLRHPLENRHSIGEILRLLETN